MRNCSDKLLAPSPRAAKAMRDRELQDMRQPEDRRGRVYSSDSFAKATQQSDKPVVNVDVKAPNVAVNVSVKVDGKNIPSSSSSSVRVTNSSNGFDGRQHETYPDISGHH